MEPPPWRGDTTPGCNPARGVPTCAGSTFSSGENQVFDRRPAPLQHVALTSRGRHSNISDKYHITPAASSLHPLVPLLHYSSTHLPTPSLYGQLIRTPAAPSADAHLPTPICYHGNSVNSGRQLVKKPLNAFMLYMKEMRQQVLREGPQRESAAINRILGRRWHALSHSEQSKYYELAKKERQLHMQLFPGWSAKDNYGKMKRKQSQQRRGSH